MRPSVRVTLLVLPLLVDAASACRGARDPGVEILAGGRAFRLDGRSHPIPGTFSIPRDQRTGIPVTNRDTVEHAVGVTLVMAGVQFTVPPDQCSFDDGSARRVFIVR